MDTLDIVNIGLNTEKSPGDLRRLTVIQIQLKDRQLTLVWKTRNGNEKRDKYLKIKWKGR